MSGCWAVQAGVPPCVCAQAPPPGAQVPAPHTELVQHNTTADQTTTHHTTTQAQSRCAPPRAFQRHDVDT